MKTASPTRRRMTAGILAMILIPASIIASATAAQAYVLDGHTWVGGPNLTYRNVTAGDWYTAGQNSISSWSTTTDVNFSYSASSAFVMTTYSANDSLAGKTTNTYDVFGWITGSSVKANTYNASGYSIQKRQFVWAHEIGHALGLLHAGVTTVMAPGLNYYDTYGTYQPTLDDRNGVNYLY